MATEELSFLLLHERKEKNLCSFFKLRIRLLEFWVVLGFVSDYLSQGPLAITLWDIDLFPRIAYKVEEKDG